jgi:hypothetical protein
VVFSLASDYIPRTVVLVAVFFSQSGNALFFHCHFVQRPPFHPSIPSLPKVKGFFAVLKYHAEVESSVIDNPRTSPRRAPSSSKTPTWRILVEVDTSQLKGDFRLADEECC